MGPPAPARHIPYRRLAGQVSGTRPEVEDVALAVSDVMHLRYLLRGRDYEEKPQLDLSGKSFSIAWIRMRGSICSSAGA